MSDENVTFGELESAPLSSTSADAGKTGAPESKVAQAIQLTSEADLAALRQMADLGITPANAQEFVQAKANLDGMRTSLANDPDTILAQLQTASPEVYFNLLDKAATRYLQHFPPPEDGTAGKGASSAPQSDPLLVSQVNALQAELNTLKADSSSRANAVRAKEIEVAYNGRVDGLVADVAGKTKMDAKDQKLLKFEINASIASDPAARKRIMSGIFADIPIHAKNVLDARAAETKASADRSQSARAAVATGGTREPAAGAAASDGQPVGSASPVDDWDDAAAGFAAGLKASQ